MRNTLAYILKNYSYKPSDSHNIINNDELFEYLVMLRKKQHWIEIQQYTKYYFPYVLQQYLGTNKYIITLNNGKRVSIPIEYSLFNFNKNEFNYAEFRYKPDLTRFYIALYPTMLTLTDRAIDATIAHELAHAKRILSGIAKKPLYNTNNNNDEKEKKKIIKNNKHEEYWTDRQLKKMLPIVNPKYNDKSERRKTLQALHQEDKTRWVTTGLIQTKTSEWWDELFPFSNNSIRDYMPY